MFTHSSLDYAKPLLREYLYTTWDDLLFHWKFRKARSPSTYQISSWIWYYKQLQSRLPAARNLIGYLDFLDVIRSTHLSSPPQQRNGFLATCQFYTATGGVETLHIIPSIKTKTSLLFLSKKFWSSGKAKSLWTNHILMYIIMHLIFRCESCLYGKYQHGRLWKSSWISWF